MHPTQQALGSGGSSIAPTIWRRTPHYADFLTQQGDPRGEFIQVQCRLEDESVGARRPRRAASGECGGFSISTNGIGSDRWLPSCAEQRAGVRMARGWTIRFARGWLSVLIIPYLSPEFARVIAQMPDRVRLLRRLFIDNAGTIADDRVWPTTVLAALPVLPALEFFSYKEPRETYVAASVEAAPGSLNDLLERMPNLVYLHLITGLVDMQRLFESQISPRLEHLHVSTRAVYPLETLARNPALAGVSSLSFIPLPFEFQDESDTSYLPFEQVRALLQSREPCETCRSQHRPQRFRRRGCALLVRSGLLKQLRSLDLNRGIITDAGARTLASCPDLKNLETLRISLNRLSKAGRRALERVGIAVDADDQFSGNDDEPMHLYDEIME